MAISAAAPTAFRYPNAGGRRVRLRALVKRLSGVDLLPSDAVAQAFIDGLNDGDPVAERFVAETYHGELGARHARDLVEKAQRDGIDKVPEAPESMRVLFEEFEQLPDWVVPELVEEGAAVWRRWAYALGALGNAGTNDTYTEGWLAVPLSLSGGYAGRRALHRYLETSRWWIEVCRPGAILTPGSLGRNISLHVRIMHVSVRDRVRQHPEWDAERWGLPISQSAMLLTLLGGSVAPAFGLFLLGHLTSPREMRAVLHFNRYCGHLVGVRCDGYFPETVGDAWRILLMADTARSYDSADSGAELVESFVPAFAPTASHRGLARLRAEYHYRVQAGYLGLYMLPWNRRRYRLPSALPGIVLLLLRSPLIVAVELMRRASSRVDRRWQQANVRRWDAWLRWQSAGKAAEFEAATPLRR
ncbi:oxygenase MpaB family protein [Mycobacterium sp. ITM-2016-00318]|uniref:oxygenase MpaB family protein n=1 Tax=Mycobacterium sp. ITM-2016-00318 TaxID=2099693 RepID=UPI000CFA39A5|nr:oxygenase MpaB family protein [Mycobacterium sp. ITM-2016-00318]WNG92493.1 oxygenase MpaB family protein [Mycobacterium sp. ITM-2016-00318]